MNALVLDNFRILLALAERFAKDTGAPIFCTPTAFEIKEHGGEPGTYHAIFEHEDCPTFSVSVWEVQNEPTAFCVESNLQLGSVHYPTFEEAAVAYLSILWARAVISRYI